MGCGGSKSAEIVQQGPNEPTESFRPTAEDLPSGPRVISSSGHEADNNAPDEHKDNVNGDNSMPRDDVQWENTAALVTPFVGFVIKTKRKQDESKVFINLFHHEYVAPIASSAAKQSVDKGGNICTAYDVVVNSKVYSLCMEDDVVHHQVCLQAIEHINIQYSETLNAAAYKLPRIKRGFIGDSIHQMAVPAAAYSNPDKSGLVPYTPPPPSAPPVATTHQKRNELGSTEVFGLDPAEIVLTEHTPQASVPNSNHLTERKTSIT